MNRVYNFAPGPSMLPLPVLQKAQEELLDWQGTGMSVMEMSHRSKVYLSIFERTKATFKEVMGIPDNYHILFLTGGATTQFAMVPMNLMVKGSADYIVSGNFAKNAAKEAARYGEARVAATSAETNFDRIPEIPAGALNPNADYVHITTNNTIFGTKYNALPETGNVPLVADMSSNILSEPMDVSKFGLIYAGAQKNIGCAGLTMVVVRDDLVGHAKDSVPEIMNYATHVKNDSMKNTPPTYPIYIAGLVFDWIKEQGGVAALKVVNERKAKLLYDALDASGFYRPTARKQDRSLMNVTFTTPSPELDEAFVKEAAKQGLQTLKGHRVVGGIRASIYNAMPEAGVQALVDFMKDFEAKNG